MKACSKIYKICLSLLIILTISLLFWLHHSVIIKEAHYFYMPILLGKQKYFFTDVYLQNYELKYKTKWLELVPFGIPKIISDPMCQLLSFYSLPYKKYKVGGIITLNGIIVVDNANTPVNTKNITFYLIDRYGNNLLIEKQIFIKKGSNIVNYSLKGRVEEENKAPFGVDIRESESGKRIKTYFDHDWSTKSFTFFEQKPSLNIEQPQEFINNYLNSISAIKHKNANSPIEPKITDVSSFQNLQHSLWMTNKWAITSITYLNEFDSEQDVFATSVNFFSSQPDNSEIVATQKIYVVRSHLSKNGWLIWSVGPLKKPYDG